MKKNDLQKVDKKKYKEKRKFFEMRKNDLKAIVAAGKNPDADLAKKELDRRSSRKAQKSKKSSKSKG